ncbi:DUF6882 domain-containing protein [Corynebacterium sp. S7]
MDSLMPSTLQDIVTDGAIAQHDIDSIAISATGKIQGVEFTGPDPADDALDAFVELRLHYPHGRTSETTGTRAALIRDGIWQWRTQRVDKFDVDELHRDLTASDELIRATRTLFGNTPVLLAPHSDGTTSVVALNGSPRVNEFRPALISGIATLPKEMNTSRAVHAFAAQRGYECTFDEDGITISDGTRITLTEGEVSDVSGGLSFAEVLADGYLTSKEHQFLFHGHFPQAQIRLNLHTGRALIDSPDQHSFEVEAQVIATVRGENATWAWADEGLFGASASQAAQRLRGFALENGIPQLLRPIFETSALDDAIVATKPILNMWTHATTALNAETTGVVLLRGPQLALPAASQDAVSATLAGFPSHIDEKRARETYARNRKLTTGADGQLYA